MVANCSNVMNKARQPPPGVMPKGRAPSTSTLDAISPVQVSCISRLLKYIFMIGFVDANFDINTFIKCTMFWVSVTVLSCFLLL